MESYDWNFTNYANESASYYCPGVTPNNLYGVQEFTNLMLNPVLNDRKRQAPAETMVPCKNISYQYSGCFTKS